MHASVYERFELNWASQRLQFYGQSLKVKGNLLAREAAAVREGLQYFSRYWPSVRHSHLSAAIKDKKNESKLIAALSKLVQRRKTEIFGSDKLRVHLELSLTKALAEHQSQLASSGKSIKTADIDYVKIKLDMPIDPQPEIRIVDENGKILFDRTLIEDNVFFQNFMGRFFSQREQSLLTYYVNKEAISIPGRLVGDNTIEISSSLWRKHRKQLDQAFAKAKLAIVSF